jgi:hypothetical protein
MPPTVEGSPLADRLWISDPSWPIKLKSDFTNTRWGITAPTAAPTLTSKNAQLSKTIENMDTSGSWAPFNITSFANDTIKRLEGTGSITGIVPKDSEGIMDRVIALNLAQFAAPGDSADEDYIHLDIAFLRPKHIKNMEIMFLVGAAAPANFDNVTDAYSRELQIKVVKRPVKKKLRGTGDFVRFKDQRQFLIDNPVGNARDVSTAEFTQEDQIAVTRRTWTRVTIPKSSFDKQGLAGTAGFTWANVQGIRITFETTKQGTAQFWIDDLKLIGGVGMQGDYKYTYTYKNSDTLERSNPPIDADGNVEFLLVEDVERQSVTLGGFQVSTDPQVDKIEVWRTLGNGEVYFKAGETDNTGTPSFVDNVADYIGIFSAGSTPTVLESIELPLDNAPPPSNIFDCARHVSRMFVISSATAEAGRIYVSPIGRPGSVGADFIECSAADNPVKKIISWNGALWAFTEDRLYQIAEQDEPFSAQPVYGVPGVRASAGRTVVATPAGLMYQANDGVRVFNGLESRLVSEDALRPIFRNATLNGINSFEGQVAAYGRNEYYVSDPDLDTGTTLALDMDTQAWRNLGMPSNALFYEDETGMLLATFRTATSADAVLIVAPQGATTMTLSTASPFAAIGMPSSPLATDVLARGVLPVPITITRMYVLLATPLAGGGTVTFHVHKNGSNQAAPVVTISSGGTSGNAVGASLSFAAGDTISINTTYTGGTTTAPVQAIMLSYSVDL